jgi:intracellular multiplication protein IcmC
MEKYSLLMQRMAWYSRALALRSVKRWPIKLVLSVLLYGVTGSARAADMQTVLTNLSHVIVPLTGVVLAISFCAGIYMIIHGVTLMKRFGNMASGTQQQPGELAGPLMQILVGAVLIYLPTSTDIMMNSLFESTNSLFGNGSINYQNLGEGSSILNYGSASSFSAQWASMADTLFLYLQFFGLLSFVKGWFMMSKSAGQGTQPGTFSKALMHIFGGVILINLVGVVDIVRNTIGGS